MFIKKTSYHFETPYVPAPKDPADTIKQPNKIDLINNSVNATNKVDHPKKQLPDTGDQTSSLASLGLIAVATSALAFFKKRKINE